MSRRHIFLCLSLDVEEEGLFRGAYEIASPRVTNLEHLDRLNSLCAMGARPTLFCAYPVFADDTAWGHVARLAERWPAEIGAHLHHWNTPPLKSQGVRNKVPSIELDDDLFSAKLESVLEAGRQRTGRRPVSFRMGRWDLHRRHWPLLARAGLTADASVRPLHMGNEKTLAPDHFRAPQTGAYLVSTPNGTIFEMPLTVTSLNPLLTRALLMTRSRRVLSSLQFWGVLALLPVYHPLWAMKAVTAVAVTRGSNVVSLTFHSSELMPGGNPRMPDVPSIDAFVAKCRSYLTWLGEIFEVTFVTLDELRQLRAPSCETMAAARGDWCWAPANARQEA